MFWKVIDINEINHKKIIEIQNISFPLKKLLKKWKNEHFLGLLVHETATRCRACLNNISNDADTIHKQNTKESFKKYWAEKKLKLKECGKNG